MADTAQRIESRRAPGYDEDWSAWMWRHADLLKQGRFGELDLPNLIDEVESLAKRDYRAWASAIRIVLLHMLKWDYQPSRRSESWLRSIVDRQPVILDTLADSPSYGPRLQETVAKAYTAARRQAWQETRLPPDTFPETCPYDWAAITERAFELPEPRPPRRKRRSEV